MTDQPNIEAAREVFAERVALAYERTWHGFGFTQPEYSYQRALELGKQMAAMAFPYPAPPRLVVNEAALREALGDAGDMICRIALEPANDPLSEEAEAALAGWADRHPRAAKRLAELADDGVVGDGC